MGTTPLIVETVIIGLQALAWIALTAMSIAGVPSIDPSAIKDWIVPLTLALIAIAYTLGLLQDALLVILFLLARVLFGSHGGPSIEKVAYILAKDKDAFVQLDAILNRARLLRATSVNVILVSLAGQFFVRSTHNFTWTEIAMLSALSLLLSVLALFGWFMTARRYDLLVERAYWVLTSGKDSESHRPDHAHAGEGSG